MSKFKKTFERAAIQKFKTGFSYVEHYIPNTDSVSYDVVFDGKKVTISIDGLTQLIKSGQSIQNIIKGKLDKEFP